MPSHKVRLRRNQKGKPHINNSEDPFENEEQVNTRETAIRKDEREDMDINETEMTGYKWPRHRYRRDTPALGADFLDTHPAFRFDNTVLSCGGYMTRDLAVREMMDHRKRQSSLFSDNEHGCESKNPQGDMYGTFQKFKGNVTTKGNRQQRRSRDILTGSDLDLRPPDGESTVDVVHSDLLKVHGEVLPVDSGILPSDLSYYAEKGAGRGVGNIEGKQSENKMLPSCVTYPSTDWRRMSNKANDERRTNKQKSDALEHMLRYYEENRIKARRNVCFDDSRNGFAHAIEISCTDKEKQVSRLRIERASVATFEPDSRVTETETTSDLLCEFKNNKYSPSFQNPETNYKRRNGYWSPDKSGSDSILFQNDYETLRTTSDLRVAVDVGSETSDNDVGPDNQDGHANANYGQNDFEDGTQSIDDWDNKKGNQEAHYDNHADTINVHNLTEGERKPADRGALSKPNIHAKPKVDSWQKGCSSASDAKKGQQFQIQIHNQLNLDQIEAKVQSRRLNWEPVALRHRAHVVNLDSNKEFLKSLKNVRSKINTGNKTLGDNAEKQWSRYMHQQVKPKTGLASGRKSRSAKAPKEPAVNDVSALELQCRPVSSRGIGTAPLRKRN